MRSVRLSRTFAEQLLDLLAQGEPTFGPKVAVEKKRRVLETIHKFLAVYPAAKPPHPGLGLRVYPIQRTAFVVIYDFDDTEVRVHFVVHEHAELAALDPAAVAW